MAQLPETYAATRQALHSVAEHVLAPARYAATGRIGLQVVPGGIGTPPFETPEGEREVSVVGGELVVVDAGGERRAPLTGLRQAADFVGVTPGAPSDLYTPSTPLDLDAPLAIEPDPYQLLAGWFELVDHALRTLRDDLGDRDPSPIQLWPEHFDLAFTAGDATFGGSPGDAEHDEPYLYVSPPDQRQGPFWNDSFGASRSWSQVGSVDDAVGFLREGAAAL